MDEQERLGHGDVELVEEEVLYKGFCSLKRLQLRHRLFRGGWSDTVSRELCVKFPAVTVLPYDPVLDQIILIEQFRVGCLADTHTPWQLEVVAGVRGGDELPETVAKRELHEETGLDAMAVEEIMAYWVSPGLSDEYVHAFCIQVNAQGIAQYAGLSDEHEDIKVHPLSVAEVMQRLHAGEIHNGAALISLQWFSQHHQRLRALWSGHDHQ